MLKHYEIEAECDCGIMPIVHGCDADKEVKLDTCPVCKKEFKIKKIKEKEA